MRRANQKLRTEEKDVSEEKVEPRILRHGFHGLETIKLSIILGFFLKTKNIHMRIYCLPKWWKSGTNNRYGRDRNHN